MQIQVLTSYIFVTYVTLRWVSIGRVEHVVGGCQVCFGNGCGITIVIANPTIGGCGNLIIASTMLRLPRREMLLAMTV